MKWKGAGHLPLGINSIAAGGLARIHACLDILIFIHSFIVCSSTKRLNNIVRETLD